MYDELVAWLRSWSELPAHCECYESCGECDKQDLCSTFTNESIITKAGEAADAIEELICEVANEHNARLDAEETIVHCNNEENAKIIATLLNMDADGHYLLYSSIFGEEEEPAPPKE